MTMTERESLMEEAVKFEDLLKDRGWRVEVMQGKENGLVQVIGGALVDCMDGRGRRGVPEALARGPKIQGGVLGVAALRFDRIDRQTIKVACREIREIAGFVPAVHGDTVHGEHGCGFGVKLAQGRLSGLGNLDLSLDEVRSIVESEGGKYVVAEGSHEEKYLRVNLVPNTTVVPNGGAFEVDLWVAGKLGVDPEEMLMNAIETIEALRGPRVARVMV